MSTVTQTFSHTPWWVLAIAGFLVYRGIQAGRPNTTRVLRLFVVPAVFLCWGGSILATRYAISVGNCMLWAAFLLIGGFVGHLSVHNEAILADHDRGVISRPGDRTYLPLLIVAFLTNYAFATIAAIHPSWLASPGCALLNIAVAAHMAGIFLGKAVTLTRKYAATSHTSLPVGNVIAA
ncbi:hypothetical protein [Nguyenibacter vanlangensis]|uniref:DUF1453 domain-containing protein n=1 Tax=Nguyenibacter vanlangensis TaxID=1216886 RepID=A0A7Y7M4A6_9PROT|nr:hypothetical protein [Nguyenibacter vanlangensis]NVN09787.1 hypothetical protein [Nguyenibacter vanlangensis]